MERPSIVSEHYDLPKPGSGAVGYSADQLMVRIPVGSDRRDFERMLAKYSATVECGEELGGHDVHILRVPPKHLMSFRMDLAENCEAVASASRVSYRGPMWVPIIAPPTADPLADRQTDYMGEMRLPSAWAVTTGDSAVLVGVCDTGIDTGHPDLVDNMAPASGLYPDKGYDYTGTGLIDRYGHGTAVAGCVAAVGNNSIGVTGTAPGCKVYTVKLADGNSATSYDIAMSIKIAANRGCDIINVSWGGEYAECWTPYHHTADPHMFSLYFDSMSWLADNKLRGILNGDRLFFRVENLASDPAIPNDRSKLYGRVTNMSIVQESASWWRYDYTVDLDGGATLDPKFNAVVVLDPAEDDAITYAWNMGAIVVVAAGNSSRNGSTMPAMCTHALSVGAAAPGQTVSERARYSNFGPWVDVWGAMSDTGQEYTTTTTYPSAMLPMPANSAGNDPITLTGDVSYSKMINQDIVITNMSSMEGIEVGLKLYAPALSNLFGSYISYASIGRILGPDSVTLTIPGMIDGTQLGEYVVYSTGVTITYNPTITGTATAGSNLLTGVSRTAGVYVGQYLYSEFTESFTMVTAVSATTITLSKNALSSGTGKLYANSVLSYAHVAGTSFAAPTTAGVLALMKSANRSITNSQLRDIIISSGRDFTTYFQDNLLLCGGKLVDAFAAVREAWALRPRGGIGDLNAPMNLAASEIQNDSFTLSWVDTSDPLVVAQDMMARTMIEQADLAPAAYLRADDGIAPVFVSTAELVGMLAADPLTSVMVVSGVSFLSEGLPADQLCLTVAMGGAGLVFSGAGSIRSPSGEVINLVRTDGSQIILLRLPESLNQ